VDKKTAKETLLRSRPWLSNPDPEDSLAAAEAARDPELHAAARQAEQFNARVYQELAEIPVPPTLRGRILARRIIIPTSPGLFRRRVAFVATLAACFALLAAGLFWVRDLNGGKEDLTFSGFRARMIGFAVREYRMDVLTADLGELRRFLRSKGSPDQFTVPPRLGQAPLKGGAALTWQTHPVSMVCFESPEKTTLYLFVINARDAHPSRNAPEFAPIKQLATASWTADGKTYLLGGKVAAGMIQEFVQPVP
jgi:hypothetical protein